MSVLGRLVGQAFGRRRAGPPANSQPEAVPACTNASTAHRVLALSDSGSTREASKLLIQLLQRQPAASAADAATTVRNLVLPVLQACVRHGDAVAACDLDLIAYEHLVKRFESPDHYESTLRLVDEPLYELGMSSRGESLEPIPASRPAQRLLFFFQFLSSNGAHVELFSSVLGTYLSAHAAEASRFGIVGVAEGPPSPSLQALRDRHGVSLHALPLIPSKAAYDAVVEVIRRDRYDRLVVVAMPVGISYLSGRLPASRLAWWSMKFELGCFEQLQHRCALMAAHLKSRAVEGKTWRLAPPMLRVSRELAPSAEPPPKLKQAVRAGDLIFYTVNREEKIRNPGYLQMVCRVLELVPKSRFLWTGRQPLAEVVTYFDNRGLSGRHNFVGWIHPDDLLTYGSVFLDTPVLSGTVAARAAVLGRPVVTMAKSQSWISVFLPVYEGEREDPSLSPLRDGMSQLERIGLRLEARTEKEYIDTAVRLATDAEARAAYVSAIRAFATYYFLPNTRSAELHLSNLAAAI